MKTLLRERHHHWNLKCTFIAAERALGIRSRERFKEKNSKNSRAAKCSTNTCLRLTYYFVSFTSKMKPFKNIKLITSSTSPRGSVRFKEKHWKKCQSLGRASTISLFCFEWSSSKIIKENVGLAIGSRVLPLIKRTAHFHDVCGAKWHWTFRSGPPAARAQLHSKFSHA